MEICFIVLLSLYIYDAIRFHKKIKARDAKIKKLTEEKEALIALGYHSSKTGVFDRMADAKDGKEIEKELREKYNLLSRYFDDMFPWFHKEVKEKYDSINAVARKKHVPQVAVLYAILFFQVTEQLKFGDWYVHRGRLNMRGFDLYALWKHLANKLEHYRYFPAEEIEQRHKEIDEWISNNG